MVSSCVAEEQIGNEFVGTVGAKLVSHTMGVKDGIVLGTGGCNCNSDATFVEEAVDIVAERLIEERRGGTD